MLLMLWLFTRMSGFAMISNVRGLMWDRFRYIADRLDEFDVAV
jgi:hypothetical protein